MMTHSPKNTIVRIDQIWAAVSVDPDDNTEGVCAVQMNDHWMPLIAADEERLPFIREQAARLASLGRKIKIIRLTTREVVEEF